MNTKNEIVKTKIAEIIHSIDATAEVVLFGSKARGDDTSDSDWDILVLTKYPVTLEKEQEFRHSLLFLELEVGEAFSTFVYSKNEWLMRHRITPFFKNISKEGIRI